MKAVSVIGLGAMGSALAGVLLRSDYEVTVWNRSPEKAANLVQAGARLAATPSEAIRASPATITCVRSHADTRALLADDPGALAGRTIIELSTGASSEAAALMTWLEASGATCLIGMIAVFPKDIGTSDSAILTVGDAPTWAENEALVKTLAGASALVGDDPAALAAMYASLVLPRQGFMFGMIYGAMICKKAGISMEAYAEALPLTIRIVHDYHDLFAATVPGENFDDPPASLGVYHAAFKDVLGTFGDLGVPDDFPRLLHDLLQRGMDAGLEAKQVTSLTKLLAEA